MVGLKAGLRQQSMKVKTLDVSGSVTGNIHNVTEGSVWFVDRQKATSTTGNGSSWIEAFLTITEAINVAGDNDIIYIAAGTGTANNYTETNTITITQDNLKLIGANVSHGFRTTNLRDTTCLDDIITIKAHGVEIRNLSFYSTTNAKAAIAIGVDADATSYHGIYIHDCYFYATSGEYAIMTFTAPDAPDLRIEDCKIQNFQTAGIKLHATRGTVRGCYITVPNNKVGIAFTDRGAIERIEENIIIGGSTGDTGITLSGDNRGNFVVAHNTLLNLNTSMTQDVGDEGCCWNYLFANGTTPTVVDVTS